MLYDDRTADLAKESASKCDIRLIPMKVSAFDISLLPKEVEAMPRALSYEQESDTLAIIFHTSGSTGTSSPPLFIPTADARLRHAETNLPETRCMDSRTTT